MTPATMSREDAAHESRIDDLQKGAESGSPDEFLEDLDRALNGESLAQRKERKALRV